MSEYPTLQPSFHSCCPVCDSVDLIPWFSMNGYAIHRCRECSLVFVRNRITNSELDAHYAAATDEEYEAYRSDNTECLNYYYEALRALIEVRHPQPGKLLDVGCSRGWFLDVMRGWECYGNEIVESDAAVARSRYGESIFTGQFEEYPSMEEYFDVITLQDVFDHMREPVATLERCHRMLKPGGTLVIKVHNISCLYAKLCGKSFYAIVPPSHLFYYNSKTLNRLLRRSGFIVVDTRFIAHLLKFKTVFLRLSKGDASSLFHKAYKLLGNSALGEMKIRKNLHDIITVVAVKAAE